MATISSAQCPHVQTLPQPATPLSSACGECGLDAPIRVCLSCGHVGCCDSTNGHATAHAAETKHPLICSLPLSAGSFTWCYLCNAYLN